MKFGRLYWYNMSVNKNASQDYLKLYVRHREVMALRDVLLHAQSLSTDRRLEWLQDNGEAISNAFSLIVEVSEQALSQIPADPESISLTNELIEVLREAEELANNLLDHTLQNLVS